MRFIGGAMFQWINPKAWMLALGVATAWTLPSQPLAPQIGGMAVIFAVVGIPCGLLWAYLGAHAGRLLQSPGKLRIFNISMAVLLVVSMLPVLLEP